MKTVILALLTLALLACTKKKQQSPQAPVKVINDYKPEARKVNTIRHTLVLFKQNNSKANMPAREKILRKELRADTLVVKVRSTQNCDTQYKGEFDFTDGHLNLSLTQLPKIIKRKNGSTDTLFTSQTCDGVYEFTYTISRVHALPQTIAFNGKVIY